jgi:hypothetical protein
MTDREIMQRLAAQLHDEIARLEGDRDAVDVRITRLRTVCDHFVAEIADDEDLLAQYGLTDPPTTAAG